MRIGVFRSFRQIARHHSRGQNRFRICLRTLIAKPTSLCYSVVPNSSGILRVIDGQYGIFSPESTGVFKVDPGTNKINVTVAQNYQGDNHAFFDLSGANAIYGGSSTVQPAGLYGLYLVRAYEA